MFNINKNTRKGQGMVFGLILLGVSLFAYSFMLPMINDAVNLAAPNVDASTLLLMQAIPIILLAIILAIYFGNPSPVPIGGY